MNYASNIKRTNLDIRYEINRSVQVCPNCEILFEYILNCD